MISIPPCYDAVSDCADFFHGALRSEIMVADKEDGAFRRAGGGLLIADSVDRHRLYAAQTPPIFESERRL